MGTRNRRRLTRRISGQVSARIPGPALVPFLLFWCLGSFALGQDLSRVPLAALAAAAIHPLQSALRAQGALAHDAPVPSIAHTRQVATGLLGGRPSVALARKTSGKTGHGRAKQSSQMRALALRRGMTVAGMTIAGARASHGQVFIANMDGASAYWASNASWSERRGWTVAVAWDARFAAYRGARRGELDYVAGPCSP